MTEAILSCWAIVGCLAVAAACNHGWHHVRDRHLTTRLQRASGRHPAPVPVHEERGVIDEDVDAAAT